MKTALEILNEQNKLKNEYDKKQIKIKGQLRLIEDKINTFKLTPISKYINLGNMGDIYEENLVEILNAGYFIDNINNETHLYFNKTLYDNDVINKMKSSDEKDYNNYVNSNRIKVSDNPIIIGSKEDINNIKDKLNGKSEEKEKDNYFAKVKVNDNEKNNSNEFETITDLLKYINNIVR